MRTVLSVLPEILTAAAALAALVVAYTAGIRRATLRIRRSLFSDREVGIAVLEELADRWSVKIVRQETPGG
jgi:hypothetical protein